MLHILPSKLPSFSGAVEELCAVGSSGCKWPDLPRHPCSPDRARSLLSGSFPVVCRDEATKQPEFSSSYFLNPGASYVLHPTSERDSVARCQDTSCKLKLAEPVVYQNVLLLHQPFSIYLHLYTPIWQLRHAYTQTTNCVRVCVCVCVSHHGCARG